ncbi:flagellar hook-basal body complex protein FliE [Terriglobus roseus DSM 18391]|uniref:Flagellar hook-basal body complex protein FliE n=2 Tax=Terriglobus roseus TaxID=392734 RepID=I3ZFV0_TERRK|nr:flagellar hook-basal body complex protein FliE [Terriglobus roseus DSM 18391]
MLPIQNATALREALLQSRTPSAGDTTVASSPDQEGIFGGLLQAAQHQIKAADTKAQQAVTGLLSGQGVEVHEAMIATQQADLTFELALQVRNKAVSAYQQMMQMQF